MGTAVQTLLVLAVVWILAYQRARMSTILFSVVTTLAILGYVAGFAWLPWAVLAIVAFFYFAAEIRIRFLTLPVFRFFQKVLPPMNSTETEALEAGDIWWEAELFRGNPDWNQLLEYPAPRLTETEQS